MTKTLAPDQRRRTARPVRAIVTLVAMIAMLVGVVLLTSIPVWSLQIAGQPLPPRILQSNNKDFDISDDVVALHYYGVGGWGIKWRGEYLLTAPYFSNHGIVEFNFRNAPDLTAIAKGFNGTPLSSTGLVLVGHGHVDHAADISGYVDAGLPANQAGLIANRTTLNMLASLIPPNNEFRCAEAPVADGNPIEECTLDGFRITPLRSAHAPNVKLFGNGVTVATGSVDTPQDKLPERPADYRLGVTWAYLIDLLDEDDKVQFRIHYMDAAAGSNQSHISTELLQQRSVDIHIACVPGYDYVDDYPEWIIEQGNSGYVMLGHWEDFFSSRNKRLKPVTLVLSEKKLNDFVTRTETALTDDRREVAPINKSAEDCPSGEEKCGPRGESWAMPTPGETYHFRP